MNSCIRASSNISSRVDFVKRVSPFNRLKMNFPVYMKFDLNFLAVLYKHCAKITLKLHCAKIRKMRNIIWQDSSHDKISLQEMHYHENRLSDLRNETRGLHNYIRKYFF